MKPPSLDLSSWNIRILHGTMVTDGILERLDPSGRFEIVLAASGLFTDAEVRIPVSNAMLAQIQIHPDGHLQIAF